MQALDIHALAQCMSRRSAKSPLKNYSSNLENINETINSELNTVQSATGSQLTTLHLCIRQFQQCPSPPGNSGAFSQTFHPITPGHLTISLLSPYNICRFV